MRGEDSFVRAQWAGQPFVWHIYPQDDGAHAPKLEAFMARAGLSDDWAAFWRGWNGLDAFAPLPAPNAAPVQQWRAQLAAQPDLLTQLMGFIKGFQLE